MKKNTAGFLCALTASGGFGLIPLFTLPLLAQGMQFDSIQFYRFLFAGLLVLMVMIFRREPLYARFTELAVLSVVSGLYTAAALLVVVAYTFLPSGITATIMFLYPVFVAVIMMTFFRERKSVLTFIAIGLAVGGVALLSLTGGAAGSHVNLFGVGIILLAALCNALYIVGMYKGRLYRLTGLAITFYLLFFGAIYSLVITFIRGEPHLISSWGQLFDVALLGVVTAGFANIAFVEAVKFIGSTMTAIMGAFEPLTAVCVGIVVFHESLTVQSIGGILLILGAVAIIILARPIEYWRLQRRHKHRMAE